MLDLTQLQSTLDGLQPRRLDLDGFKPSAVLVPVVHHEGRAHLLFTQRTESVEHHKGQISFPGGRLDEGETLAMCALRETHEEIGVQPQDIRLIGRLDDIWTPTRYVVSPFVGVLPYPYNFVLSEGEIAELFLAPIAELADPGIYQETEIHYEGKSALVPYYHWRDKIIWGATGRIIRQFLTLACGEKKTQCVTI
ncbi:MAG TPA: CoA pyrophosphatase [bacterium]|nr:CoA pyrophosphatase [bacterium]